MTKAQQLHIGVLCGGMSSEREISLRSGLAVQKALKEQHIVNVIEMQTDGTFLLPKINRTLDSPLRKYNVIFNALHGRYGEDGKIQGFLDLLDIPYTGSGVLASALAMDKNKTNLLAQSIGLHIPKTFVVTKSNAEQLLLYYKTTKSFPCVVKPNQSGSSVGVFVVQTTEELHKALEQALREDKDVLVQQQIIGKELTCAVLGNAGETLQALPVVEIVSKREFFDYTAKYHDLGTDEICPAVLEEQITNLVQTFSKQIHELLGCDGLTRSDFILAQDGTIFFLEINTSPGLTEASLCPKEAQAVGIPFDAFLLHIIDLALMKRNLN